MLFYVFTAARDGEQVNTMTIREQALALGSAPSQVHKWRTRGMPADLGPAQAWLQANVKRRGTPHPRHGRPRRPAGRKVVSQACI